MCKVNGFKPVVLTDSYLTMGSVIQATFVGLLFLCGLIPLLLVPVEVERSSRRGEKFTVQMAAEGI